MFMGVYERINKIWHSYTMEYYSACKRKEILTGATTWTELEDITLKEGSQSQKRQILNDSTQMREMAESPRNRK